MRESNIRVRQFQLAESVPGAAIATGAQASSLAITRRDNAATGTVELQSDPVATAPDTDFILISITTQDRP